MTVEAELKEIRERLDRLERFVGLVTEPAPLPPLELGPLPIEIPPPRPPRDVTQWVVRDEPVRAPEAWAPAGPGGWHWRDPVGDVRSTVERFLEGWVSAIKAADGRPVRLVVGETAWPKGVSPAQAARALWRWLVLAAAMGLEVERPKARGPEEEAAIAAIERDLLGRTIRQCAILGSGEVWADAQ